MPFKRRHLSLLRVAFVKVEARIVSIFVFQISGISDDRKIEMALDRLLQRFGVRGGLYAEPKIKGTCHGPIN